MTAARHALGLEAAPGMAGRQPTVPGPSSP